MAEIRQAVRELQQHLSDDLARVRGDQPCAFLRQCASPTGPGRKGALCSSVTKNWRNTMGTWNSPVMSCWGMGQPVRSVGQQTQLASWRLRSYSQAEAARTRWIDACARRTRAGIVHAALGRQSGGA